MLLDNKLVAAFKSLAIALPVQVAEPEAVSTTAVEAKETEIAVLPKPKSAKKRTQEKSMNKEQMKALKDFAELIGVEVSELTEDQQAHALTAASKPAPVDVEAIVTQATEKAIKAAMEAAPAINGDAGKSVTVTQDEADRPFKSIVDQLIAVKAHKVDGKTAPRLNFLKATGASEGIPSDGGFLLDPTLTDEVLKPIHEDGPFSSLVRRLPVGNNSNSGYINGVDETSRVTGSRWGGIRGYRLSEGATKTRSAPTFRRINWELKKYAVVAVGTDELLADAAMWSAIVQQGASEELNFMVNDDIMNGIGLAGPQGFMQSGALISAVRTDANEVDGADISRMWNRMDLRGRGNAIWFVGNDTQPQLDQLFAVSSTAVLYPWASMANGVQGLYGRPIVTTEFNPALGTLGDIVLCDMSQYLLWEKGGVESSSSIHVYYLSDETAFRFVYRVDGKSTVDSALTPYIGSTTTSPFVALAATT
jgi:HK97 family phage major capsid protein